MMPQMDGIELCWMIRENSEIPMVPFIFLTSFDDSEMEIRGFRAGADDYLNKPIDRNELLDRVQDLLSRTNKLKNIEDTTETRKAFSGDLSDLSIVELVQMLNLNKKSGILTIKGKAEGEIYIRDGHLFGARTEKNTGEQAFYDLVVLTEGTFNFEISEQELDRNINNSTMNVIMEACRIMDENRHFEK
jgi:YesN/AraC family two-component response regulator